MSIDATLVNRPIGPSLNNGHTTMPGYFILIFRNMDISGTVAFISYRFQILIIIIVLDI